MHTRVVQELDAGLGRFTVMPMWKSLYEMFLPLVRTMVFPDLEPYYLVQGSSPSHMNIVVKPWFRQHPEISLSHIHPNHQILVLLRMPGHSPRSYLPLSHHHCSSNYGNGVIELCRQMALVAPYPVDLPVFAKLEEVTQNIKGIIYFKTLNIWNVAQWSEQKFRKMGYSRAF